jgi:bifunctional DNase/RNase
MSGGNIMVEVTIDSVRVSLMSQHRIVVLKELDATRYLPIWIGPFEADAITIELQGVEVGRPLTHDLLKSLINKLGAEVEQVTITDLRSDTFYAQITLKVNGREMQIDSRPSDAIALAVRSKVPVYVADEVMEQAAITPEQDLETSVPATATQEHPGEEPPEAFKEFLEGLDLSGLE